MTTLTIISQREQVRVVVFLFFLCVAPLTFSLPHRANCVTQLEVCVCMLDCVVNQFDTEKEIFAVEDKTKKKKRKHANNNVENDKSIPNVWFFEVLLVLFSPSPGVCLCVCLSAC